jgi:uncharacterized protein (UPF0548 family)
MFLLRRPPARDVEAFLTTSRQLPLSYNPIGLAGQSPHDFDVDEQVVNVGQGNAAFERAKEALAGWKHFSLGWVELFPAQAAVAPGVVVAVLARHLGFWSLNGCRVVYLIGARTEQEFGFAYGTLSNHAEAGEEVFKVAIHPKTGAVSYVIRAVSRARAPIARLGYPVTRALQARFRRDSARALTRAIGG